MDLIKKFIKQIDEKYLYKFQKQQKIYLLIFLVAIAVLLWAFVSAGVITHNFNRSVLKSEGDKQELAIKSMILTESKNGEKSWEIYGETGEYASNHKVATLYNVIGNFYKANKVNMSFQSSKGTYNEETEDIDLYENTYVALENNVTVIADRLTYFGDSGTIIAKGNVKINQDGKFIAYADEAFVNSDFDAFQIKGHTKTEIYESKNKRGSK